MINTLNTFEIKRLEILDEEGNVDKKLMPNLSQKQIKELYYWMNYTRIFDQKALSLQRTGRLGTYASTLGQEAANIGSVYALKEEDWLFPSFRMNGGMMYRGVPAEKLYQYWGGDERGMRIPDTVNVFPICITVGEQPLHATGYAWGKKIQGQKIVALTDFGDGATSEGDFHEALNFASVFEVPVIFVCQNNHYAISVPLKQQTHSQTLAQKAIAYGMTGIQVDGNDVFAMYSAVKEARESALKGKPVFIEAYTYRRNDHTTSDDAKRYRSLKEVQDWEKKDPILRLKKYLEKQKLWTREDEDKLHLELKEKIDTAVKTYENTTPPSPEDLTKYLYAGGT